MPYIDPLGALITFGLSGTIAFFIWTGVQASSEIAGKTRKTERLTLLQWMKAICVTVLFYAIGYGVFSLASWLIEFLSHLIFGNLFDRLWSEHPALCLAALLLAVAAYFAWFYRAAAAVRPERRPPPFTLG